MALTSTQRTTLLVAGLALAVPLTYFLKRRLFDSRRMFIRQMVDPQVGRPIADTITAQTRTEGDFILAAWKMVGEAIAYEDVGSILLFKQDTVRCELCLLPGETLRRGRGNCVAKALLLASILRNRFGPEEVFVAIGQLHEIGQGGHAWVVVRLNGRWELLETTTPPTTWRFASALEQHYETTILFNDQLIMCDDPELCMRVQESSCLPCMLAG